VQLKHTAATIDDLYTEKFRVLLHQAIRDGLKEGVDKIQINGAIQLHQGWMHIHGEKIGQVSFKNGFL